MSPKLWTEWIWFPLPLPSGRNQYLFKSENIFFGFCNLENGYLQKNIDQCGLIRKFQEVSLNETSEFPFWGLYICVHFNLRIRKQTDIVKKPHEIIYLNKNIGIFKTAVPHSWNPGLRYWFSYQYSVSSSEPKLKTGYRYENQL